MTNPITLWLDENDKYSQIAELLKTRGIPHHVKYFATNGRRHEAILFTPLGTFEGDREIRQVLGVLASPVLKKS